MSASHEEFTGSVPFSWSVARAAASKKAWTARGGFGGTRAAEDVLLPLSPRRPRTPLSIVDDLDRFDRAQGAKQCRDAPWRTALAADFFVGASDEPAFDLSPKEKLVTDTALLKRVSWHPVGQDFPKVPLKLGRVYVPRGGLPKKLAREPKVTQRVGRDLERLELAVRSPPSPKPQGILPRRHVRNAAKAVGVASPEGHAEEEHELPPKKQWSPYRRVARIVRCSNVLMPFQLTEGSPLMTTQRLRKEAQLDAPDLDEPVRAKSKKDPLEEVLAQDDDAVSPTSPSLWSLAVQLNLPPDILKTATELFEEFAEVPEKKRKADNPDSIINCGFVNIDRFGDLLCKLVGVDEPGSLPESLWRNCPQFDSGQNSSLDFLELVQWYSMYAFSEDLLLGHEQKELRKIARECGMKVTDVEHYKQYFDSFDEDESGRIDEDEFAELLAVLLKVPADMQLPSKRVRQFWLEADMDGSGSVTFDEFLLFYRKFFDIPKQRADQDVCPMQEFYRRIRRTRFFAWDREDSPRGNEKPCE